MIIHERTVSIDGGTIANSHFARDNKPTGSRPTALSTAQNLEGNNNIEETGVGWDKFWLGQCPQGQTSCHMEKLMILSESR